MASSLPCKAQRANSGESPSQGRHRLTGTTGLPFALFNQMKRKGSGPDYSTYDIVETIQLNSQLDNAAVLSYIGYSELARRLIHCAYEQEKRRQHRIPYAVFRCDSRYCLYCAYREAQKNVKRYAPRFNKLARQGNRFSTLALTIPNEASISREMYSKIFEDFRKLLHRKPLKNGVVGSIAKLETTFNETSATYHPHIQTLMAYQKCSPQGEVMAAWIDLTSPYFDYFDRPDYPQNSPKHLDTHIQKLKKSDQGSSIQEEIADAIKYISKPITFPTADAFLDYFLATKGMRLMRSYGMLRMNEKAISSHYLDIRGAKSTFGVALDEQEKTQTVRRAERQAPRAYVAEWMTADNRGAAADRGAVEDAALLQGQKKLEEEKAKRAAAQTADEKVRRAFHMPPGIKCERCNTLTPPPSPLCEQCKPLVEAEEAARKSRKLSNA